jgi:hypothetical protein
MVEQSDRKEHLRGQLASGREALLTAVNTLSETDLARSVGHESHWTAKDLIGHIAYAEGSMLPLIERAQAGDSAPPRADFDIDRWNDSRVRRARDQSVADLLGRLTASRQEALALLDRLSEGDLDRPATHPTVGVTTVAGIFRIIAAHERDHARELRAVHDEA